MRSSKKLVQAGFISELSARELPLVTELSWAWALVNLVLRKDLPAQKWPGEVEKYILNPSNASEASCWNVLSQQDLQCPGQVFAQGKNELLY